MGDIRRAPARAAATIIATLALCGAGLATASPATARAEGYPATASSTGGIIFGECTDHPISYSVSPPPDVWQWHLNVQVQSADGTASGGFSLFRSAPTTGADTLEFCPSTAPAGSYTGTGTFTVTRDSAAKYEETTTQLAPFAFTMRYPNLQATAKASDKTPRVGQRVKVEVWVGDERPTGGYFGAEGVSLILQRLQGGKWVTVRGARGSTGGTGREVLRFRHQWTGRTKFRVHAKKTYFNGASSPVFTLRGHR